MLAGKTVDRGVPDVVVTLGESGALWASAAGIRHFPAYPVRAVDTTGAGDAFNAGLVAALVRGEPMERRSIMAAGPGFPRDPDRSVDGVGYPSDLAMLGWPATRPG